MLNRYFIKPQTLDRIQTSWLATPIESYVGWLAENGYAPSSVRRRVPILMHFAEFARDNGARAWDELPGFVDGFVENWVRTRHRRGRAEQARRHVAGPTRVPVEQMLSLLVPGSFAPSPYAAPVAVHRDGTGIL